MRALDAGSLSRVLAIALAASAMALSGAAAAQDMAPPESYQPTDANGVNLATGTISVSTAEIGAGPKGGGGLFYSASYDGSANGWRHSTWGGIHKVPDDLTAPLPAFTVTVLGQSVVFERLGQTGAFQAVDGYGSLTFSGGVYTFTALDGTTATFIQSQRSYENYEANEGVIQEIIRPDGERISFTYVVTGSGPTTSRWPLSVSNNLGYQIHVTYPSGIGNRNAFTVRALNNGVDACAPTATNCTFSRPWPTLTFAQPSATERTVTDSLTRVQRLGFNSLGRLTTVARPSRASGWSQTIGWTGPNNAQRVLTVADGAGTWTYSIPARPSTDFNTTSTVTDPNNNVTQYNFAWEAQEVNLVRPELRSIVNGEGEETQIVQDGGGLHSATFEEGNGITVTRNARGDVETITRTPKPGSTLVATTTTAVYGDCSTPIRCGRPTAITDARGNTTTFTYAAHGGLESITEPAPTVGATQPQTRFSYGQHSAWYKNASGVLVAANPVWRQTGSSQCAVGVAPA